MKQFKFSLLALLICGTFFQTAFSQSAIAKNKATITAAYAAFDAGNIDAWDNYVSKNIVDHSVPPGMPAGAEGTKAFMKAIKAAFPDAKIQIFDMIAEGDYVAVYSEFRGTQKGEFMDIPATGKAVRFRSVDLLKFDQTGKSTEHLGIDDNLTMMQQLGLAPAAQALPNIPLTLASDGKTAGTTPEQNKMVSAKFFEVFSKRDIPGDLALLASDFKLHWNSDPKTYGPGTYKMLGETYLKAFGDVKWTPTVQIAEGDKVVSFTTYDGTQTGPLMDIPASNKTISGVKGVSIDRYVNGKIAERTQINDDLDMLSQLGVIPSGK